MSKPQISFQDGVDLPFMIDLYPEDDDGECDLMQRLPGRDRLMASGKSYSTTVVSSDRG